MEPAAQTLYLELINAGFEDILPYFPDGETFWSYLKSMALEGTCDSCREGSGNSSCRIRVCAKERGFEMCAFCADYPCERYTDLLAGYPVLKEDNRLLQREGQEAWGKMQDERRIHGYVYSEKK